MSEGGVWGKLDICGAKWPLSRMSSLKHEKCGPAHLQVPPRGDMSPDPLPEPMFSPAQGLGSGRLWLVFASTFHLDVTHFC